MAEASNMAVGDQWMISLSVLEICGSASKGKLGIMGNLVVVMKGDICSWWKKYYI